MDRKQLGALKGKRAPRPARYPQGSNVYMIRQAQAQRGFGVETYCVTIPREIGRRNYGTYYKFEEQEDGVITLTPMPTPEPSRQTVKKHKERGWS